MLTRLNIKNFLLIDQLSLNFSKGMTVFTGETGAGKSILYDALWLTLGVPIDKDMVQKDKHESYVEAYFDIRNLVHVKHWVIEQGYDQFSRQEDILCLKRVILSKGRSKALINDRIVRIDDLKVLGSFLVNLYGQHHHQRLLKREHQREYLDHYGGYQDLLEKVDHCYKRYGVLEKEQRQLLQDIQEQNTQLDLRNHQIEELTESNIVPGEWISLNQEHNRLTHAEQVLQNSGETLWLMTESEPVSLISLLQDIKKKVYKAVQLDDRFQTTYEILEQIIIQSHEAESLLRHTMHQVTLSPARLAVVEQRINLLNALARKHKINVEELPHLIECLQQQQTQLEDTKQKLIACQETLEICLHDYKLLTEQLTIRRRKSADSLQKAITEKIQELGMLGGYVEIRLPSVDATQPLKGGKEWAVFYFSSIPDQKAQILSKVASGGELSRINLVIQTLLSTSRANSTPTLIFDEIDTGIGGSIAEQVGRLLYNLGKYHQVICITHLPQIAALTHQHYQIAKQIRSGKTNTVAHYLNTKQARIQEISRMLGGIHISDHTIAHAQSLLMDQ